MAEQDDGVPSQKPRTRSARSGSDAIAAALCIPRDVRAAIAHLRANPHRAIPLAELAGKAGVSMRTLEAHFRAFVGVAPSAYGVRLRLNAARHDLQGAGAAGIPVTTVALRYGFTHLGRFSRDYRRAFGESPSETRRVVSAPRARETGIPSPVLRGDRPAVLILPFTAPPALAETAEFLALSLANALAPDTAVLLASPRFMPKGWREIAARYVLQGWLAQEGERLRIVLRLLDAETGTQLWGDAWTGAAAHPFAAIDRVAAAAASVLPNIRKAEIGRTRFMRPQDMDTYQLCLRAYPLLAANTAANTRQALELLYRAIERDPDYGLPAAFAGWGHVQLVQQIGSATPAEDRARALLMAARAGMLDGDNTLVLTARSVVHTMAEERALAGDLVSRALARNPRLAWAWERDGWLRAYRGDWPGAIATFGRALRLDPANPAKANLFVGLGAAFFGRGHYALAARWMERALEVEPNAIWVNRTLAVTYARLGEGAAARQAIEGLRRYRPDIRVRDVAATMHFPDEFVSRVANGLDDFGLPP